MSTLLDPVPIRRKDHRADHGADPQADHRSPRGPHRSGPAATPQPVLDVAAAVTRFQRLGATLPGTAVHYAVRANPAPALLTALASAGCRFDVAGPAEVVAALEAGAAPSDLTHSGPVGLVADIAFAARLGVRLFAVRSHEETRKVAAAAPGAAVLCRIAPSDGVTGPHGCSPDEAVRVLRAAAVAGLDAAGVSFRLGPQQRDPAAWGPPVARSARVYDALRADGLEPWLLDLGGGFPGPRDDCPPLPSYGAAIETFLRRELGTARPQTLVAPGRTIAAAALGSSRNRA